MPNQTTLQNSELDNDKDMVSSELNLPLSTVGPDAPAQENSFAPTDRIEVVEIRGMPIHSISLSNTVKYVVDACRSGMGGWVVTPNLDILRRYKRSPSFRNLVATSTLNVADGMPLVWASQIQGEPVPGRVNGTDLMLSLIHI